MLYKLFKLLNSSSLSASGVSINFKKGPKAIAKSILWILLFLYVFGVMIVMYTLYMVGTYKYLAASGNQQSMPLITMLLSIIAERVKSYHFFYHTLPFRNQE